MNRDTGLVTVAGIISQYVPSWTAMIEPIRIFGILGLAALLMLSKSPAVAFEDLYTVTVPLEFEPIGGQEPLTEEYYVRLAMGRLLTRVTGQADAVLVPALEDLVQNAAQFVVQRGYPDRENLLVTFDSRAVGDVLVQRNQPIWGEERPMTLLWVAIDAGFGERGILSAETLATARSDALIAVEDELRAQLELAASERGLPITLPLWDLQDAGAIDFIDVWGGFSDRVRQASGRYGADAVLSGRVRVTERGLAVQWTLLRGSRQFILPGGSLRSGLDRLADLYADEFSSIGGALTVRINVVDIETLEDYGQVMRYIEDLSVLNSVDVEDFSGTTLRLRVAARGGSEVLEKVLTLSDVVTQRPSPTDDAINGHLTFALSE